MSRSSLLTILFICAFLIAGIIFTYSYTSKNKSDETNAFAELANSVEAQYTKFDGTPFSFEELGGKILVINSWASWCPFCTSELNDLEKIATEFADKGVVVVAINRAEPLQKAKKFLSKTGNFERTVFVADPTDYFYSSNGGFAMPETIILDKRGDIVTHKRGVIRLDEMRTLLESIINKQEQ